MHQEKFILKRKIIISKNPGVTNQVVVLSDQRTYTIYKQGVCVLTKGESVCLVTWIPQYKIMLPLFIAFRSRFFLGYYYSRIDCNASMRSEIVPSCSATLLRKTNSSESLTSFSGTVAMKFWSKHITSFLNITFPLIVGDSVPSTKELLGRERSLSTYKTKWDFYTKWDSFTPQK